MNWLRAKLRAWLIGDIDKTLEIAIQVMKAIEQQGLEKIQAEMGAMFFSFPDKKVTVKAALMEFMRCQNQYLDVEKDHKGELYPVIKQIRKPVSRPKLKKLLDVKV
jgi:hypothetical protein